MTPMKMIPACKQALWGGDRLRRYGKSAPPGPIAESWEVSCHCEGESVAENGPFAGSTLRDVLTRCPKMRGSACAGKETLPVLIKLIDAAQSTSLQVHPGDAYAQAAEGQSGKNELWYVLDACGGAQLTVGCKNVPREELARRVADGTVTQIVNTIAVKAGDCFAIPAGMLHAIGGGILLAEVQQSSNITYRIHDYGRKDEAGNARPLQIDKALDVVDTSLCADNLAASLRFEVREGCSAATLTAWEWFTAELIELDGTAHDCIGQESFSALLVLSGTLCVEWNKSTLPLCALQSLFLPAGLGEYILTGSARLLRVHLQRPIELK